MNNRTKSIAVGTLLAGAMGYVAGILTAPKSGKETREMLGRAGSQGIREAEKNLKKLHTELNGLLSEAATKGKAAQTEVVDKAQKTKQKTREVISALHDGNAEDQDLDEAVTDVSKAIDSIKKFLRK
jgi:gas vesicle protein